MPKHLTLCDCLQICHHCESLQYHLNVVKLTDKPVESISKHHFNRGGRQPSAGAKKSGTFRSQPIDKPVNSANTPNYVVGISDLFVVEINGQQYRRNKHDITFSPPKDNDGVVGGATGNQHAEEQVGTENKTDRLRPRPTLKFPKLPTQATLHSDFEM